MKTVKSLLLGTAAGFVAFTGAQAADLPMAEPVEYVRICDTYGKGYFYIPGTDTCLKLSGYVRFQTLINFEDDVFSFAQDTGFAGIPFNDDVRFRARGDVRWDARSETEWGTLRSFIEIRGNDVFGSGSREGTDGNHLFDLEQAFIQFAGLTIGRAQSFFDYIPYDSYEDFFDDNKIKTIAYTASFGSGFAATIGVEDKSDENRSTLYADEIIDQVWPNAVAALRVDQAWGSAQISAALQDNEGDVDLLLPFDVEDTVGWAVMAGVSINLPTANDGSFISAQGCFTEGAIGYCGAFNYPWATDNTGSGFGGFISPVDAVDGFNSTFWQAGGAIGFQATETINLQLVATAFEYEDGADEDFDFNGFKLEGKIVWTPVDNLDLGLALQYVSIDGTETEEFLDDLEEDYNPKFRDSGTVDDLRIEARAQRSF